MKKLILILLIPFLFSCGEINIDIKKRLHTNHSFLDGKHELQRIGSGTEFRASFFVFNGGSAKNIQTVSFSWMSEYDGIYNFTTIPLDALRIKIVNGKKIPTIEFHLGNDYSLKYFNYPADVSDVRYYIHSATVECDTNHWGLNINLPLGNQ